MKNLRIAIAISFLLALLGCNGATTSSTPETSLPSVSTNTPQASQPSPGVSPTVGTSPVSTNTPATENTSPGKGSTAAIATSTVPGKNQLISSDGIGAAKVGMTFGELKKALAGKAQFQVKSPFIVDFDAIAVSQGGEDQFYILYPTGTPLKDTDVIEALVTNNPKYRTPEGIGPGTPVTKAEAAYGEATLSYNTMNESREYVKFTKQPAQNISFRLGAANDSSLAGIYPSAQSEYNQTQKFKPTASIGFVEVYCDRDCPLPSP